MQLENWENIRKYILSVSSSPRLNTFWQLLSAGGHRRHFCLSSVSSVKEHRVQQVPLVLGLELLDEFLQFVVEILAISHALRQLAKDEGADRRVLLVVDDVHVQHVHGLLSARGPLLENREHRIVTFLLAGYDHVEVL